MTKDPKTLTIGGTHHRLTRLKGRASAQVCACGVQAKDWAYQHGCPDERLELSRQGNMMSYCHHLECYVAMCQSCHVRYDYTDKRRTAISAGLMGHTTTEKSRAASGAASLAWWKTVSRELFEGTECSECGVLFCCVTYVNRHRKPTCTPDCALKKRSRAVKAGWVKRRQ